MFQTIIFAYDGSAECQDALEEGIALASRFNARCHLLAVIPPPPAMALANGPLPGEYIEEQQARVNCHSRDRARAPAPGRGGSDRHPEDGRIVCRSHRSCRP